MSARLLVALLGAALTFTACTDAGSDGDRPRRGEAPVPSVEVVQARYGALPLEERLTGTVRAENQVVIYSEIAAPVVRVAVEDGDYVEAGAPLVYLRDTQFREQLRQAEAALQISQAEAKRADAGLRELRSRLERTKQLAQKDFQSAEELEALQAQDDVAEATHEQALARIAQAEATVEEEREALRRTVIRAPISGRVGQRNAEIGMRVDGGTRLFTIGNLARVRVEVAIPDEMLGRIEEGQTALITSDNLGDRIFEGAVSRISPFMEAVTYSAKAEIDLPNPDGLLRPGMFVTVDVLYGESEQATLVPTSALYEDPNTGALGVYVAPSFGVEIPIEEPDMVDPDNPPPLMDPTPMEFREIEVLARGRGLAGISGVQPEAWVVIVGQNLLRATTNGEAVQARARPTSWARVGELQELQDQDLLRQFMEKQQRLAREGRLVDAAADVLPPEAEPVSARPARNSAARTTPGP